MSYTPTHGEKRVRIDFNASNSDHVAELKRKFAELIDQVMLIDRMDQAESIRLKTIAINRLEEAAMWAVKAATA